MKTHETQFGHSNLPTDDGSVIGIQDDLDSIINFLTPSFMKKHTVFSCLEDFLQSAEFSVATQQDFEMIPVTAMDAWVHQNSTFPNWSEMVFSAGDFYIDTQLKDIKLKSF